MFERERRKILQRENKLIMFTIHNKEIFRYPILDITSLRVVGLFDASFAVN